MTATKSIKPRKKESYIQNIFFLLLAILSIPFILIIATIYYFIHKDKNENILFENEHFKINIQDYLPTENSQEWDIFNNFCINCTEYCDDDFLFFKLIDEKQQTELNQIIISSFKEEVDNIILLQKMEIENNKLNSYLVSFDKNTGKTDIIIEIGNFFWLDFNLKKRLIIGYNNSEKIEIYLNS